MINILQEANVIFSLYTYNKFLLSMALFLTFHVYLTIYYFLQKQYQVSLMSLFDENKILIFCYFCNLWAVSSNNNLSVFVIGEFN